MRMALYVPSPARKRAFHLYRLDTENTNIPERNMKTPARDRVILFSAV